MSIFPGNQCLLFFESLIQIIVRLYIVVSSYLCKQYITSIMTIVGCFPDSKLTWAFWLFRTSLFIVSVNKYLETINQILSVGIMFKMRFEGVDSRDRQKVINFIAVVLLSIFTSLVTSGLLVHSHIITLFLSLMLKLTWKLILFQSWPAGYNISFVTLWTFFGSHHTLFFCLLICLFLQFVFYLQSTKFNEKNLTIERKKMQGCYLCLDSKYFSFWSGNGNLNMLIQSKTNCISQFIYYSGRVHGGANSEGKISTSCKYIILYFYPIKKRKRKEVDPNYTSQLSVGTVGNTQRDMQLLSLNFLSYAKLRTHLFEEV